MYKFIKNLIYLSIAVLCLSACRKKAYDDFYGRPASLAQPIYQVLQARGNFTNLLACIDKAGYTDQLSTAGYWTMFAPNDDAFKKYFALRGISSVAQIDAATAAQIVSYSLAYNAAGTDHISDYQSPNGYVTNQAFKRRTSYHGGIYTDTVLYTAVGKTDPIAGQIINAVAANRNNGYQYGDFNNKYIPYFTSAYLSSHNLSATDYNYFYPKTTYTGFNVADGAVVNADIPAENGIIHEINSVILPLKNLEAYLKGNANYSHFKQLFDKYYVQYQQDVNVTHQYQVLTGKTDVAYVKTYFNSTNAIGFSLNNENYLKLADNDGQSNGYTLFAPTNAQLDAYINTVILEHYPSLDKVPLNIIQDFLNAHMYQVAVWPTKFASTNNILGEPAKFDANRDVIDKYVGSNGFFYGVNKVQAPNNFSTVFGRPYLDRNYTLMTIALNSSLRYVISNPAFKFTIFMVTDSTFKSLGYNYSTASSAFTYTAPGAATVVGGAANNNFYRIVNMLIASTPNGELNDLSGSGIFETGPGDGTGGEYVKYNANTIFAAGNVDLGQTLKIVSSVTTSNGKAYYTTGGAPQFTTLNVGQNILAGALLTTSPFYNYYQYLLNSPLYTSATGAITGIQPGVFYTVLVPSNTAILQAVKNGFLPATTPGGLIPNYKPTAQSDIDLVTKFIQYHIIKGTSIVTDGKKSSPPSYPTLLNDPNTGNPLFIQAFSSVGALSFLDNQGRRVNVVPANSNVLSNYAVIHQIDNYLNYN